MAYTYEYPRPALTVDCVVFGFDEGELKVLLIERGQEPFKGQWALPGGFVRVDETLDAAARRELQEEAGLTNVFLEQLYTFGELARDYFAHENRWHFPIEALLYAILLAISVWPIFAAVNAVRELLQRTSS